MVSEAKTKTAALILTLVVLILLCLPIDVSQWGISQGCTLWQRLCYPFLHAGILHAALNCWALLSIVFSRNIPLWQLVAAYIIATTYPVGWIGGSGVTVGLSGVIFALLGIILLTSIKWWVSMSSILLFICIGFFLPHVDATLHLYCFLIGLVVGCLNIPII